MLVSSYRFSLLYAYYKCVCYFALGLLILLLLLSVLVCLVLIRLCWCLLLDVIGVARCVWVWADCLLLGGYLLIVSIVVCCVGVCVGGLLIAGLICCMMCFARYGLFGCGHGLIRGFPCGFGFAGDCCLAGVYCCGVVLAGGLRLVCVC